MPVADTVPFTQEDVEQMNTRELHAAWELRFDRPLLSGNLPYVRAMLQRAYATDGQS